MWNKTAETQIKQYKVHCGIHKKKLELRWYKFALKGGKKIMVSLVYFPKLILSIEDSKFIWIRTGEKMVIGWQGWSPDVYHTILNTHVLEYVGAALNLSCLFARTLATTKFCPSSLATHMAKFKRPLGCLACGCGKQYGVVHAQRVMTMRLGDTAANKN